MDDIDEQIVRLKQCRCREIDLASLYHRNKAAHKWKAPFRSKTIRECTLWRVTDLIEQSRFLHVHNNGLGARILIRSALESTALLVYLNQSTESVLSKKLSFHVFSDRTSQLLSGSRDGTMSIQAINIMTIIDKMEKDYPGSRKVYDALSESAHPNWFGLHVGYVDIDHDNYVSNFRNKWEELIEPDSNLIRFCLEVFKHEYEEVWLESFKKLEKWIELNDSKLEQSKRSNN